MQCDFQVIYASGLKGKAGLSPDDLADDLGPLFEAILRCIPEPTINKDGALQMLVSKGFLLVFHILAIHKFHPFICLLFINFILFLLTIMVYPNNWFFSHKPHCEKPLNFLIVLFST